jgi:phosphoglucomutase
MTERAGTPARESDLVDIDDLLQAYEAPAAADQPVVFGTSGHRGSSLDGAFTDTHIAAITQAIVEYRAEQGVEGPVFVGADTHALRPTASSSPRATTRPGMAASSTTRRMAAPPTRMPPAGSRDARTRSLPRETGT